MFDTLIAKTFTILGAQLFVTWLATAGVLAWIRSLYHAGAGGVVATRTEDGELDLALDWDGIKPYFYALLIVDLAVFFVLLFKGAQNLAVGIPLFTVWSVLTGIELALVLISVNENLGCRVLAITATVTFGAALVGMYSGIDFSFMSGFLFGALLLLLLGNLIRIFVAIPRATQRVMAFFGVLLFTAYLVFDFNRLARLEERGLANSWNAAMVLAIDIYLDIVNLFLDLLDLMSD